MSEIKFEAVTKYADVAKLPVRATANSAGYDLYTVEDTIIPSMWLLAEIAKTQVRTDELKFHTLAETAAMTKRTGFKPTLVSTGVKCKLPEGYYLELVARSSTPLKYMIILANSVGRLLY